MAKIYEQAESVEKIAQALIPNYHPHLGEARLLYMFVDKASTKGGREVLGKAQKITGWTQHATDRDFLILVALDKWNDLTSNQRTALVDHLLERCFGEEDENSGEMKWSMREPDVHEFSTILERYGAWHDSLVTFVQVAKEVELDNLIEEEAEVDLEDELVTSTED